MVGKRFICHIGNARSAVFGIATLVLNIVLFCVFFYGFRAGMNVSAIAAFALVMPLFLVAGKVSGYFGTTEPGDMFLRCFKYLMPACVGLSVNLMFVGALSRLMPDVGLPLFQLAGYVAGAAVCVLLLKYSLCGNDSVVIGTSVGRGGAGSDGTVSLLVLLGLAAAIVFHYMRTVLQCEPYPVDTFLFLPADQFNDYYNMIQIVKDRSPYFSGFRFDSNYFPAANVIFYLFSLISAQKLALVIYLCVFFSIYLLLLRKEFLRIPGSTAAGMLLVCVFSYPVLFAVDRANVEIFMVLFVMLFFHFYRMKEYGFAALMLSVPVAMKIYPAVFVVLFLRDRKFREVFIAGASTLALTAVSLLWMKGGLWNNVHKVLSINSDFMNMYSSFKGIQHGFSFYGFFKVLWFYAEKTRHGGDPNFHAFDADYFPVYAVACFVLFSLFTYVIAKRGTKNWKAVLLLTVAATAFPNISFDYKLMYFFVPVIFFFQEEREQSLFNRSVAVLFALLLVPKAYIDFGSGITVAVLINPLIIALLMVMCLLPEKKPAVGSSRGAR